MGLKKIMDIQFMKSILFLLGMEFSKIPDVPAGVPLVCDMSSNIGTRSIDVSKVFVRAETAVSRTAKIESKQASEKIHIMLQFLITIMVLHGTIHAFSPICFPSTYWFLVETGLRLFCYWLLQIIVSANLLLIQKIENAERRVRKILKYFRYDGRVLKSSSNILLFLLMAWI